MKSVIFLCALAFLFWFLLFSPLTSAGVNFWPMMTCATGILAGSALWIQRKTRPPIYFFRTAHVGIAVTATLILYALFFVGNNLVRHILPFGSAEIRDIYAIKHGFSPTFIGILLLVWIGPAEEIFWRGFVQYRLGQHFGERQGYLLTSVIYGLGHIWALNLTLVLAALLCGLFWGWLLLRFRSIWPGLISHGLWDLLIFVLFPLNQG